MRKLSAILWLVATFLVDLILSSLTVARIVLTPGRRTHPAILIVPVRVRRPWAVVLYAYLTSLTPGSTCLHVSEDRRRLYLHLLDAPDAQAAIAKFTHHYERHILELER